MVVVGAAHAHAADGVAGHALVRSEALLQQPGGAQFHLGADEPVRHAEVVALELDVVIDVDLGGLVAADDEARRGQRLERTRVADASSRSNFAATVSQWLG